MLLLLAFVHLGDLFLLLYIYMSEFVDVFHLVVISIYDTKLWVQIQTYVCEMFH